MQQTERNAHNAEVKTMTTVAERTDTPNRTVLNAVTPPEGYTRVLAQPVAMDDAPVWHLRFEPAPTAGDRPNLGGEHFSAVVAPDGALKGVTWLDRRFAEGALPEADRAQEIARNYLRSAAPDRIARMDVKWVRPHDEQIRITDAGHGRDVTVTGMKVKCRSTKDKRYFWVIVGPGDRVLTFERDIVWNTLRQKRQTEQWLHDAWLAEQRA
jgi:hypothetical protein